MKRIKYILTKSQEFGNSVASKAIKGSKVLRAWQDRDCDKKRYNALLQTPVNRHEMFQMTFRQDGKISKPIEKTILTPDQWQKCLDQKSGNKRLQSTITKILKGVGK